MLVIIPDNHGSEKDAAFNKRAKALAQTGSIRLVLENYMKDQKDIAQNVFGVEDTLIWLFTELLMTFDKYLDVTRPLDPEEKLSLTIIDVFLNEEKSPIDFAAYFNRRNIARREISQLINRIFKLGFDQLPRHSKDYFYELLSKMVGYKACEILFLNENEELTIEKAAILKECLPQLKKTLRKFALELSKVIRENNSVRIAEHPSLNSQLIDDIFLHPELHLRDAVEGGKLNLDTTVVDLRNQVFAEYLAALPNSNGDTWFVVGKAHVIGLLKLLDEQYPALKYRVMDDSFKNKMLSIDTITKSRYAERTRLQTPVSSNFGLVIADPSPAEEKIDDSPRFRL